MQSVTGAADSGLPPAHFEQVTDVNERVQTGDLIYDSDDDDWYYATRLQVGSYIDKYTSVYRVKLGEPHKAVLADAAPKTPTSRRIYRTRRPVENKQ